MELFLTDPGEKDAFLAQVKRRAPKADLGLVEVKAAPSSRTELLRHINRLKGLGSRFPFEIQGIGHSVDGTSIKVMASDAAKADTYFATAPAARLANGDTPRYDVLQGQRRGSGPLLYTRQDDSSPFYAGAALDNAGNPQSHCTAGIPAVSTWDGLDATGCTRYLNGVRSNLVNDEVCQLGYNSKVVCGIRVTNVEFDHGGVITTVGVQKDGATAARGGDSGGPVITINHPDSRELNGIVRGGWTGYPAWVVWVDVWDIFNAFAIKLNPS